MDPLAMITGVKTAIDLATTIKNYTDDIELKTKTSELYDAIINLQNGIMAMQAENHQLLIENHNLKNQIETVANWNTENERYELTSLGPAVHVYALKGEKNSSKIIYILARNVFKNKKIIT